MSLFWELFSYSSLIVAAFGVHLFIFLLHPLFFQYLMRIPIWINPIIIWSSIICLSFFLLPVVIDLLHILWIMAILISSPVNRICLVYCSIYLSLHLIYTLQIILLVVSCNFHLINYIGWEYYYVYIPDSECEIYFSSSFSSSYSVFYFKNNFFHLLFESFSPYLLLQFSVFYVSSFLFLISSSWFILMVKNMYHLHDILLVPLMLEVFIIFLLLQFVLYFETFFSFDLNFKTKLFFVSLRGHLFSSLFIFPYSYVHLILIIPHYFSYLIPLLNYPLTF